MSKHMVSITYTVTISRRVDSAKNGRDALTTGMNAAVASLGEVPGYRSHKLVEAEAFNVETKTLTRHDGKRMTEEKL